MEILLVFLGIAIFFILGIALLAGISDSHTSNYTPSPSGHNGEVGYWINAGAFFAQAEDGDSIWRMHTDGTLTEYKTDKRNTVYKYEVMRARAIHCDVPRDSIFFATEKYLWLGHYGLNRYEKYIKEHGVWVCMDKFSFDAALKEYQDDQRS